jgi:hypothetical protein
MRALGIAQMKKVIRRWVRFKSALKVGRTWISGV